MVMNTPGWSLVYLDSHEYTWMVIDVPGWSLVYLDGH